MKDKLLTSKVCKLNVDGRKVTSRLSSRNLNGLTKVCNARSLCLRNANIEFLCTD